MTPDQVITAVDKYALEFSKGNVAERCSPVRRYPTEDETINHVLWMCEETRRIAKLDVEKAMRWLGFIQGVLWTTQGKSVEDMMLDNT